MPPIVLMALPGSLSSAVSAALGCHPDLHFAPELHLFAADTLGDLRDYNRQTDPVGGFTAGLEYATRSLGLLRQHESRFEPWLKRYLHWTPSAVIAELTAASAPRRLLIKSTQILLDRDAVNRMIETCPDAIFLHLQRHPVDNVRAWLRTGARNATSGAAAYLLQLWARGHRMALEALPTPQRLERRAEDLLSDAQKAFPALAGDLGLRVDPTATGAMSRVGAATFLPEARRRPGMLCDERFSCDPVLRSRSCPRGVDIPPEWRVPPSVQSDVRAVAKRLGYL